MNKPDACAELLKLKRCAFNVCKNESLADDLLSEAILIFLESKQEFETIDECQRFVHATMQRLWSQKNNEFGKKYGQFHREESIDSLPAAAHSPFDKVNPEALIKLCMPDGENDGRREYVNNHLIAVAMDQLHYYYRYLLILYSEGNSYRTISKMTGINHVEIYKSIQSGRQQIFQYLNIHG